MPFFSRSASEFVEMLVGVGASRVRDLFEQAKKDAPSIIFIEDGRPEQATAIARQMVGRWGMSERLGLVSVLPGAAQEGSPDARHRRSELGAHAPAGRRRGPSDHRGLLRARRRRTHRAPGAAGRLAAALLEHETLDEADAYHAAGLPGRSSGG